jgi:predicted RNase H-like HicB family nuclease
MTVQVHFEDGTYWATVDECPGLFAAGDTEEELFASVADGLRAYLATGGREPHVELLDVAPADQPSASRTVKKTLITA